MNLSAKGRRLKGVVGEREVKDRFETAGFEVRGLEGLGDHLVVCSGGLTLHVESKRQERIEILRWSRQAEVEAPQGTIPIVAYRPSRERWRASLPLDDLISLLILAHDRERLRKMVVAHHAVGAIEGALVGDRCPVCAEHE